MTRQFSLILGISLGLCALLLAAMLVPTDFTTSKSDLVINEPGKTPDGMVWVSGGRFVMGTNELIPPGAPNPLRIKADEYPAHEVELDGFWMDSTPVTNREFSKFVEQTGYKTFAERQLTKQDFADRGADISGFDGNVIPPGSMCFNPDFNRAQLVTNLPGWEHQVWKIVDGADWRHPDGPESSIENRMDHPVVHIAWEDAVAYCDWAGKRLPTEAEFEYAARSGGKDTLFPWGEEILLNGKFQANYWQGDFPTERKNEDGFLGTSPVKSFPPNELGLYDLSGNVWEWCSDLYAADYYLHSPRRNPKGPLVSFDPEMPGTVLRVQRGGSFLCNVNNCTGYRTRARGRGDLASSRYHNGFRCVVDSKMLPSFQKRQQEIQSAQRDKSVAMTKDRSQR